jgi:hypothetical protein
MVAACGGVVALAPRSANFPRELKETMSEPAILAEMEAALDALKALMTRGGRLFDRRIAPMLLLGGMLGCSSGQPFEPRPAPESSERCGVLVGETAADIGHVRAFCARTIPKDTIMSAHAMQSTLWLNVPRHAADTMRSDRMTTEQFVKDSTAWWKIDSGDKAVTLYVRWQGVEIAKSETHTFSADRVTIH